MDIFAAIHDRVETESQGSGVASCDSVMNEIEMTIKHLAALLIAAIPETTHRVSRYGLEYRLLRTSGVGDWVQTVREVAVGNLHSAVTRSFSAAGSDLSELTRKVDQSEASVALAGAIRRCLAIAGVSQDPPRKTKLSAIDALHDFSLLRNKLDAHGAPTADQKMRIAAELGPSIRSLQNHLSVLRVPVVSVKADAITGRPNVVSVADAASNDHRNIASESLAPLHFRSGLYAVFGTEVGYVALAKPSADCRDFFYANGDLRESTSEAEFLSYISSNRLRQSIVDWLPSPAAESGSETAGSRHLVERGNCFTNAPVLVEGYVERPDVQDELRLALTDDRRMIVTLKGPGGAGKTSTALRMIDELCNDGTFDLILWFSSRDIDLRTSSSVRVKPEVVSLKEVERSSRALLEEVGFASESDQFLRLALSEARLGSVLWVFDNFETLSHPIEVFSVLDSSIRRPHKVLITTRHRDSKGDYPIEVSGLSDSQFHELVESESRRLGVEVSRLDENELLRVSGGHPYIAKILIHEIRISPRAKYELALSRRGDLLEDLFGRTFDRLAENARHVYLLLCSWRSDVPEPAVSIALSATQQQFVDADDAFEQLEMTSLIVLRNDGHDRWINVPFPAWDFGHRKLLTDPHRVDILAESEVLRLFGPSSSDRPGSRSLTDSARRFWRVASEKVGTPEWDLWRPRVERLAKEVPSLWAEMAQRYSLTGMPEQAITALRRSIEAGPTPELWHQLAQIYERIEQDQAALDAWVQRATLREAAFDDVSFAANKVNGWLRHERVALEPTQRRLLVEPLVATMEARSREANAVDFSRLGWLYVNIGDRSAALRAAERGLGIDPESKECQSVIRAAK